MLGKYFTSKKEKAKIFALPLEVITDKGIIDISSLKIGDFVLGRDGNEQTINKVEELERRLIKGRWILVNGTMLLYENQSVMIGQDAIHAKFLKVGQMLATPNGTAVRINTIKDYNGSSYYYHLRISGDHTFFYNGMHMHNASRFWVGGTATWDATVGTKWATLSGGAGGSTVPTVSDDVFMDAASGTVVVTMSASVCLSYTGTGFTGTIAGGSDMSVSGNVVLGAGQSCTMTGAIIMQKTTGASSINTNGVAIGKLQIGTGAQTMSLASNVTLKVSNTAIVLASGVFAAAGFDVTLTGNGASTSGALTFFNLKYIPASPLATDFIAIPNSITVTGTFTVQGTSQSVRAMVVCGNDSVSFYGTTITITAAAVSFQYVDFRDITAAGAANWNLSAITGGSGNMGGNTGITFSTPVDQHWVNASGGSWSTAANWTSRVPLPQDNVFFNNAFGTAQTVTADMPRLGANIDWTGATWTTSLTVTHSIATRMYGSLTLIAGLTWTASALTYNMFGRGANTLTGNGVTIDSPVFIAVLAANSVTLGGNLVMGVLRTLSLFSGTFTVSGSNYSISAGLLNISAGGTLTLGSNTHSLTGTGTVMTMSGTLSASTGTVQITDTSNTAITFGGGGKTWNNILWTRGPSTAINTITGTNTFANFSDVGSAAHTITFPNVATTCTTFNVNGHSKALITLIRTGASGTFTISVATGAVQCTWVVLSNSTGSGGATFAAINSTDGGTNTGWLFSWPDFLDFMTGSV